MLLEGRMFLKDAISQNKKNLLLLWYINSWESQICVSLELKCSENWIPKKMMVWGPMLVTCKSEQSFGVCVWVLLFFPHHIPYCQKPQFTPRSWRKGCVLCGSSISKNFVANKSVGAHHRRIWLSLLVDSWIDISQCYVVIISLTKASTQR